MKPALRRQLLDLGVPLERHDAVSLSGLFPPAFQMADSTLSEADIAKVLVEFVKRGLIFLAAAPDEAAAARIGAGAHICHFYRDRGEMVRMTAAFLQDGLRSGERSLWVLPSWLEADLARAALRAARPGLDDAEAAGRQLFFTEAQVYLDAAGALRSADAIIAFWLEQEAAARSEGYTGIRITGDGTGLVAADAWRSGVDYECRADEAFKGRRIAALCTYSLEAASAARLAEVLGGHARGLVRRGGAWDEVRPGSGVATAIELLQSAAPGA